MAAERETSLLISALAELMTSSAGVNEPLRPNLMIILGASRESTERAEGDGSFTGGGEKGSLGGGGLTEHFMSFLPQSMQDFLSIVSESSVKMIF